MLNMCVCVSTKFLNLQTYMYHMDKRIMGYMVLHGLYDQHGVKNLLKSQPRIFKTC